MTATETLPLLLALLLGLALGALLGLLWARGRAAAAPSPAALEQHTQVRDGLDRLDRQLHELEKGRASWQGEFSAQVSQMRRTTEQLGDQTHALATALRKPAVRGRWGELHLRKAIETAGLVNRCDFVEQDRFEEGRLRPDVVVRLTEGRCLVIDSKVPLDAFLDATGTDDPDEQAAHLARHLRQVRTHVDQLGAKRYWRALSESPEFVVLFLPGEAFLSHALESDPALLEYAAERQVVLATPTTLIALLRTVAHGWSHQALTEQAGEVLRLGRELHERVGVVSRHLDGLGAALARATTSYNSTVGSLESRVLVSARRFADLGVTDDELPSPRQVSDAPRRLTSVPRPVEDTTDRPSDTPARHTDDGPSAGLR